MWVTGRVGREVSEIVGGLDRKVDIVGRVDDRAT